MREFKDSITGKDKEREELEAVKATADEARAHADHGRRAPVLSRAGPHRGAPHTADRP